MSAPKYLIWRNRYIGGTCVISEPKGVEKRYQLNKGISRLDGWPTMVTSSMDPEFPKDIALPDNLFGSTQIIVSTELRDALLGEGVTNVEYLPVQVLNHKKKPVSRDYFIVNPLTVVDCIDVGASGVKWHQIDPTIISRCNTLVIRPDAVPAGMKVFRPKHLPMKILVLADLAKTLEGRGFSALWFSDPAEFTG